jgi:dihydroxyacetone kinase-like predicted kinase
VPQGLSAILRYLPDGDFDRTVLDMTDSLQDAITGEITTATRSVEIDGVQVNEGQIIALLDGITLFRGENLPKHEFNTIIDAIRDRYPAQSIEPQEGGQPHYQFIISIE